MIESHLINTSFPAWNPCFSPGFPSKYIAFSKNQVNSPLCAWSECVHDQLFFIPEMWKNGKGITGEKDINIVDFSFFLLFCSRPKEKGSFFFSKWMAPCRYLVIRENFHGYKNYLSSLFFLLSSGLNKQRKTYFWIGHGNFLKKIGAKILYEVMDMVTSLKNLN